MVTGAADFAFDEACLAAGAGTGLAAGAVDPGLAELPDAACVAEGLEAAALFTAEPPVLFDVCASVDPADFVAVRAVVAAAWPAEDFAG
jgi:hypothetical protein